VADPSIVPRTISRDPIHDRDSGYGSAFPVRMSQEPEVVGEGAIVGPRVWNHGPREWFSETSPAQMLATHPSPLVI
jgi:hypothetical protein